MNSTTEITSIELAKERGSGLQWSVYGFGRLLGRFALTGLLVLGMADATKAQTPKYGAGFTLGASHIGELNSGALGLGGGTPVELLPGTGFILRLHIDSWYGQTRRVGIRYQGAYLQPQVTWITGERSIDTATADISVLLRPMVPESDDRVIPYLAAGLGGIWYDLGRGPQTTFDPADAYYDGSSRVLPAALVSLGVDILLPPSLEWHAAPIRIRLEAADHISFNSPFKQISDTSRYGAVHHFRFTVGAYYAFSIFAD